MINCSTNARFITHSNTHFDENVDVNCMNKSTWVAFTLALATSRSTSTKAQHFLSDKLFVIDESCDISRNNLTSNATNCHSIANQLGNIIAERINYIDGKSCSGVNLSPMLHKMYHRMDRVIREWSRQHGKRLKIGHKKRSTQAMNYGS